jgi:hypothetical protein
MECDLLLLSSVVVRNLVDLKLADSHKSLACVWLSRIIQHIMGTRNVRLDGEDDWLVWKSLLEVIFKVVIPKLSKLLLVLGCLLRVEMLSVDRVKTIANICSLALFVGQDVSVGLVVCDGTIVMGVGFLGLNENCGGLVFRLAKERQEGIMGLFVKRLLLGRVATASLGLFEHCLCVSISTDELEERQKILSAACGKSIEGVCDQISVCIIVDLKTDGNALWCGG